MKDEGVFFRFLICSVRIMIKFDEPSMLHGDNFSHRWASNRLNSFPYNGEGMAKYLEVSHQRMLRHSMHFEGLVSKIRN